MLHTVMLPCHLRNFSSMAWGGARDSLMITRRVKADPDADARLQLTRERQLLEHSAEANFTDTERQLLTHEL